MHNSREADGTGHKLTRIARYETLLARSCGLRRDVCGPLTFGFVLLYRLSPPDSSLRVRSLSFSAIRPVPPTMHSASPLCAWERPRLLLGPPIRRRRQKEKANQQRDSDWIPRQRRRNPQNSQRLNPHRPRSGPGRTAILANANRKPPGTAS